MLAQRAFYLALPTHHVVLSYGPVRWYFSVGPEGDQYCHRRTGTHAAAPESEH
jgi:hypothetical protein